MSFTSEQIDYIEWYVLLVDAMTRCETMEKAHTFPIESRRALTTLFRFAFQEYQLEVPEKVRKSFKRNREIEEYFNKSRETVFGHYTAVIR